MTEEIGFIGLGNMGKPMAANLLKAGFRVAVFDVREEPVKELEGLGANKAGSPRELAGLSDTVFSMVRDDPQTEAIMRGEDGVLAGARPGSLIIISSTVSPRLCREIAREAADKKVGVIDAPVSGGPMGAEGGRLTIMVGGDEKLLESRRAILGVLGKNIFHFGGVGMGQVAKATNNAMLHYNTFGAMEGLNLAVKAGIKLERILELIRVSSGNSWLVEHWDIYSSMKKQGPPALDIPYKDLDIAIGIGREVGIEMPLASRCLELDLYQLPELAD